MIGKGLIKRGQSAVVEVEPTTLLQVIQNASMNPEVDIEKMERLMAMHERLVDKQNETAFHAAMTDTEIAARLATFTSVTPADNAQILALKRTLLAMVLEVDEVLIGDDDHWYVATAGGSNNVNIQGRGLVVQLPPVEEESHTMDPVLGKTVFYLPDGVQPFILETHPNEDEKANKYDAQYYVDVMTLNASAAYLLDGIT